MGLCVISFFIYQQGDTGSQSRLYLMVYNAQLENNQEKSIPRTNGTAGIKADPSFRRHVIELAFQLAGLKGETTKTGG